MSTKNTSSLKLAPKIWKNGELIDWDDARVHVMTHAIHYGSSVFEGIRAYETAKGSAVFRLTEHMQRLLNSAKIYRMDTKLTRDELCQAVVSVVRESGLDQCYLRPVMFRGLDEANPAFGVNPLKNPLETYIAAWDWGKYLGDDAIDQGVDVCVSSWTRITSNALPTMAAWSPKRLRRN